MSKIANLESAGVIPVVVFDGLLLPAKAEEQAERRRYTFEPFRYMIRMFKPSNGRYPDRAETLLHHSSRLLSCRSKADGKQKALDCLAAGNDLAAEKFFQQALTITSNMVKQVIVVGHPLRNDILVSTGSSALDKRLSNQHPPNLHISRHSIECSHLTFLSDVRLCRRTTLSSWWPPMRQTPKWHTWH